MNRLPCAILLLWIAQASALTLSPDESPLYVTIGDRQTISCEKSNVDTSVGTVTWKLIDANDDRQSITDVDLDTNLVYQEKDGANKVDLIFRQFADQYKGRYVCVGIRGAGLDDEEEVVEVKPAVDLEVTSSNEQWIHIRQDGVIYCDTNAKAEVSFKQKQPDGTNRKIGHESDNDDRFMQNGNELHVTNVSLADEAEYRCIAKGDNVAVLGEVSLKINVKVYVKPAIIKYPEDGVTGTEYEKEKFLECEACGRPAPAFSFMKSGSTKVLGLPICQTDAEQDCERDDNSGHYSLTSIPFRDGDGYCTRGKLKINLLQRGDSAMYTCEASSSDGNNEYLDSKEFEFKVIVPPKIRDFENKTADQGDTQELICRADGTTEGMSLSFQKVGNTGPYVSQCQSSDPRICVEDVAPDAINAEQNKAIKLVISGITKEDMANYTCTAKNDGGEELRNGSITVRYAPSIVEAKSDKKVFNWVGNHANMTCHFDSFPPPTKMDWRKNGVIVVPGMEVVDPTYKKYFEGPAFNGSLEVRSKDEEDDRSQVYGTYTCIATNLKGTAEHQVEMIEAVRPAKPEVAEVVDQKTPRSVSLNVSAGKEASENLPCIEYVIQYGAEREQRFGLDQDVVLNDLQPDTSYQLSVACRSAAFLGHFLTIPVKTAKVQTPSTVVVTSPIDSTYSKSYTLRWSLPSDGGSKVLSYTIRYKEVDGTQWKTVSDKGSFDFKDLKNLKPNTKYEVTIVAKNAQGDSAAQNPPFTFTTGKGKAPKPTGPKEVAGKAGLGTGAIIAIVIVLFLIILVIIDVTCYFRNQCGLLMCICVSCCGKKPPATETTEKEQLKMEEGQAKKAALPEDDETQPLTQEADDEKKDPEKDEDSTKLIDEDKKEPVKDEEDEELKKVDVEVKDGGGDAPSEKTTSTPTAL